MKWIIGSVCAALVAGSVLAAADRAGAATPYDDCTRVAVNSTTERLSCDFTQQGTTAYLPIPGIATDVQVSAVGGRGYWPMYDQPLNNDAVLAALGGVAGRTLALTVGGDALGAQGGSNGGGNGGVDGGFSGGGGGGASTIATGGTVVFVAPGGGGGGEVGTFTGVDFNNGGLGGTPREPAGSGEDGFSHTGDGAGSAGTTTAPGTAGTGGSTVDPMTGSMQTAADGTDGAVSGTGGTGGQGPFAGATSGYCTNASAGGGGGGGYTGGGGGGAGAGSADECAGGGGGGAGSDYNWPASDGLGDSVFAVTDAAPHILISWTQHLAITSGDAPDGTVGQAYSFQFTSDVQGTVWKVVSGATPSGLTLSRAGVLSGRPTTVASYGFTVQASDPTGAAVRTTAQGVTIGDAPVSFTNAPPNATKGKAYSFRFAAANCAGCVFTRVAGQGGLPHGLSLASGGTLSGTPTTVENASFLIQATSSDGRSVTQRFTMKVLAPPALAVNDVSVTESSGTARFTITLSPAATGTVTVHYATANGTAVAPGDYAATSGTLTFTAGQTARTVAVPIVNDTVHEGAETFRLVLSGASGAGIADGSGTATIAASD